MFLSHSLRHAKRSCGCFGISSLYSPGSYTNLALQRWEAPDSFLPKTIPFVEKMAQRKRIKLEKLLTEVELEIMNVIWGLGECTVKGVQDALPKGRDLAYTSVATMMKILEQKGALKSAKQDRAHNYLSLISRAEYEAMSLQHLQTNVFGGDPASMVMGLLSETDISQKEMQTIRTLIEERLKD